MNRFLRVFSPSLIAGIVFVFALATAHSAGLAVVTSFDGSRVGYPDNGLVQGSDGDFYGTTVGGGAQGAGTVYKLTPAGVVTVLHTFGDGSVPNDGVEPFSALVQGSDGDFYGTTVQGGTQGYGTVYKLTPSGVVTILHSFGDGSVPNDGINPFAALVQGTDGDFYGTTAYGGSTAVPGEPDGYGTLFKMTPAGTVTILHSFSDGSVVHDGAYPEGALIQGRDGDFYGVNQNGGGAHYSKGTVFKMTPTGEETILHVFDDGSVTHDGNAPVGLIFGKDGNLYGTTRAGGTRYYGPGVVFKLTPTGVETVLHVFSDGSVSNDGAIPEAGLVQGTDGDFYGTTSNGGAASSGTVFKITPNGQETVVYSFSPEYNGYTSGDGNTPTSALVQGTDGDLYGTAAFGGADGSGTAFRLTLTSTQPPTLTSFTPGEGPVGSLVTLTGTGLDSVGAVRFHDASAAFFYSNVTGTRLTVFVPPGAMKGTITVTNSSGSATTVAPFRITYAPVITSFSPASGPVGTVVTITGTHLDGITRVRFHEADATVYSSNAAGTQLTVTVPPGAKTGTITLDNRDALATTSADVFTVTP